MFSVSEQVLFGFVLFPDGLIQDQLQHIHCPNQNTEGWKIKTIQPKYQSTTRVSKYTAFQYLDNHKLTSTRKLWHNLCAKPRLLLLRKMGESESLYCTDSSWS